VKDSDCAQPPPFAATSCCSTERHVILQAFAAADPSLRGALIDRNSRLWWLDLASPTYSRSNLSAYDAFYRERVDALSALDDGSTSAECFQPRPIGTECLTCEFSEHCHGELEAIDDVSLTRFTSIVNSPRSALTVSTRETNWLARSRTGQVGARQVRGPRKRSSAWRTASDESSTASMN